MKKWERKASANKKLELLFRWIKENDNSEHPNKNGEQKMTPKELIECYGEEILRDLNAR